ncbi:MAG: GWxTD domain-containing protein [Calditrichaeota bacterium]|nr:GWxTD domain-containing protein [Calditrichota bacterium]
MIKKISRLLAFFTGAACFLQAGFFPVNAQIPVPSTGDVRFYVDAAGFNDLKADRKTYEEIYLTCTMGQLKFIQKEAKYLAVIQFLGEITDASGNFVDSLRATRPVVLDSLPEKFRRQSLFQNFAVLLKPGNYWLDVTAKDYASGREGHRKMPLHVPDFKTSGLSISELQLAARVISDTTRTQFYKNNFQIIPNPLRLYGTHLPVLYSYAEIYNLSSTPAKGRYAVSYAVLDSSDAVFETLFSDTLSKPGRTAIDVRGFNVIGFPSGTYTLKFAVRDLNSGEIRTQTRSFRIENLTEKILRQAEARRSEAPAEISDAKLEQTIRQIQYLLNPEQKRMLKKLSREGKIQFLANFWKSRDPNPATQINEFQQEFYKRLNYANRHYGGHKLKGWQTDRGRILILYGPPDEIERHRYELDYKPYEIWHYYKLGGRVCVFSDLDGMGIYTLIHSTFDGELHDREWKDRIYFTRAR